MEDDPYQSSHHADQAPRRQWQSPIVPDRLALLIMVLVLLCCLILWMLRF